MRFQAYMEISDYSDYSEKVKYSDNTAPQRKNG
jgi:hypothetical protein